MSLSSSSLKKMHKKPLEGLALQEIEIHQNRQAPIKLVQQVIFGIIFFVRAHRAVVTPS